MIKKENRLKKNRQFIYIYKHGEIKHSKNLSVVFVKTKLQPYKVGFTVSTKIGNSVVRSKVKRRLTECFNNLQEFILPTHNLVFLAKEGIGDIEFLEMQNQMKIVLSKAGLLRNE